MLGAGYSDDMMFGPAQSMGGMYGPAEYSLPPTSSLYLGHAQPYADPRDNAILLSREALEASPELLARYRAQADLLGRAGVLPNGLAHPMTSAQGTVVPGMYGPESQELGRYDLSSSSAQAWAHPGHGQSFQDGRHIGPKVGHGAGGVDGFAPGSQRPFPGGGGSAAVQAHSPTHGAAFPAISGPHGQGPSAASSYAGGSLPFPNHHVQHSGHSSGSSDQQRRSEELSDDFGSDHSVPSSANSSSVHLPIVDHRGRHYSASPTVPYQQPNLSVSSASDGGRKGEVGEGGFSSAFGLMSLDDPAVLAGLASDSAPFFTTINGFASGSNDGSGAHSANSSSTSLHSSVTSESYESSNTSHSNHPGLSLPTPELLASLKGGLLSAGGRDALDSKELKDFWKQYLRTPLTGPGSQTPMFPLQTPTGPGQQLGGTGAIVGRPSSSRRHSRVASLPSMKTPPIMTMNQDFNSFAPGGDFTPHVGHKSRVRQGEQDRHDGVHGQEGQTYGQGHAYSGVRTTLHGGVEDLKSYEQAVLARNPPTHLKLVPKRRGTMPGGSAQPNMAKSPQPLPLMPPSSHTSAMGGFANPTKLGVSHQDGFGERPRSSSSSLADAFGSPIDSHQSSTLSHGSSESPREGSVDEGSNDGSSMSGGSSWFRPTFKRLASQTLGPANAKRATLGPAGWDDEAVEEDDEAYDRDRHGTRLGQFSSHSHGQAALRRFSLPANTSAGIASGGITLPPIRTVTQVHAPSAQSPTSTPAQ